MMTGADARWADAGLHDGRAAHADKFSPHRRSHMAAVTPAMIKELRERTSAGMSDCKNALVEAEGDMEKAVEVILKKGIVKAASRAGKVAAEGEVATWVSPEGNRAVIVEINCQTDFVARGDDFKKFVQNVLEVASKAKKGADIGAEKYPGSEKTVDVIRQEAVGRIGENIVIRRWDVLEAKNDNQLVTSYVHMGGKLAVLAAVEAPAGKKNDADFKTLVENIAMQIAAMNPLVVQKDQLSEADVAKQRDIYVGQMKEEQEGLQKQVAELEGMNPEQRKEAADSDAQFEAALKKLKSGLKPEAMWGKICEGKITKWYTEVTLLGQEAVWDPSVGTIEKVKNELGKKLGGEVKIDSFVRFGLGEGIEKKTENLADEVAKTIGG
jgi:elongation factor Ts